VRDKAPVTSQRSGRSPEDLTLMENTDDPEELRAIVERIILADSATKEVSSSARLVHSFTVLPVISGALRQSSTAISAAASPAAAKGWPNVRCAEPSTARGTARSIISFERSDSARRSADITIHRFGRLESG
jgi:hypothetical protein